MKTTVIIIGGGTSGLMAAHQLDLANVSYILLEKNQLLGKKLLITGSSRCNVTNNRSNKEFINDLTIDHKRFLYSTLSTFGPLEVIEFMKNKDVPLQLENNFKYFPQSNRSIDILKALSKELKGTVMLNTAAERIHINGNFTVYTSKGEIQSKYLIIATGSESYPATGSTGDGLRFAKKLGHQTVPFYPAETNVYSSFIASKREQLQGIAITNSIVRIKGTKTMYSGSILFTHNGVSGPVIQHISEFLYFSLLEGKKIIEVSLTDHTENELINIFNNVNNMDTHVLQILNKMTIKRVAKFILEELLLENKKLIEISKKQKLQIIEMLLRYNIKIDKVEAKENAYVNGGGISTKELNPKTFESKLYPKLFFIGETVDVHGPIGGYNITIALSSGFSCSKQIINDIRSNK